MRQHESIRPPQPVPALTTLAAADPSSHPERRRCRYLTVTVRQAIDLTASGAWQLPDFQREFIWKPSQACELADSLWRGYPVGPLLLWLPHEPDGDAHRIHGELIADGLHRLTSLCLLFGREPAWFACRSAGFRRRLRERFALYLDLAASDSPRFVCADDTKRPGLISLKSLFDLCSEARSHEDRLLRYARELHSLGCGVGLEPGALVQLVRDVAAIADRELLVTALYYDRDQVLEVFQRLNSRGMKFRRLLLKFAMQGISGSLLGRRGRRADTTGGMGVIGR